jgi:hypothetical protein
LDPIPKAAGGVLALLNIFTGCQPVRSCREFVGAEALLRHLHELSQAMVKDLARFQAAVEARARRERFEIEACPGGKYFRACYSFFTRIARVRA